ncbi:MAG: Uroporphyrinogen decarboxylase [Candidatus Dichloromethanomonas elyunquensis]|nr:MAG: Uroporphyrinogen decarboxylase [Candidatus Dichloromethanomonas elyunquensis]
MTGKEIIYKIFKHEEVPRPGWIPFAGVHAGTLKGYNAAEVYQDGDKLFESLMEVNKVYNPDGQVIVFDLQLEPEILGCKVIWAKNGPPCVIDNPLAETQVISTKKIINKDDGRIPIVLDVTRRMKKAVGDKTALYGLFCGPFTLASHLRGTQLFRDLKKNPEYVKEIMAYTTEISLQMAQFYLDAGADVIVPVDSVASQVSPAYFSKYISGPHKRIFDYIREKGAFSSLFICGNATHILELMCLAGPDSISIDENVNMAEAKRITDKYNVVIGGNIPLTTVMLFGNQMDNIKATIDLIDSLDKCTKNVIIAPGCDMPFATPIENTIAVSHAVLQTEKAREMVVNYELSDINVEVKLPDYAHLKKPLVEAFLLDPTACAACTYMWAVAQDAQKHFGDKIEVVEYRYNNLEDISRTKEMGVKQLPSLYVNGQLKYSSIIPSLDDLRKEIEDVM